MINNDIISGLWFWGLWLVLYVSLGMFIKRVTKGITISDDQEK